MEIGIITFIIVGFLAQMIDGALGMAYGVSSTSFLLFAGVSPVTASASVHMAEVFTTFVSGISHFSFKNVDKNLLKRLVIPGVAGGVIGAYILTNISVKAIKPYMNLYLVIMGCIIIYKAFKKIAFRETSAEQIWGLGLIGGFFDAIGGGGWGPIVTSSLVADSHNPRYVIGSVNLAEFFVTFAQAVTFVTFLGVMQQGKALLGLAIGGVLAAPLAAFLSKKIPTKALMILLGVLILVLNVRELVLLVLL